MSTDLPVVAAGGEVFSTSNRRFDGVFRCVDALGQLHVADGIDLMDFWPRARPVASGRLPDDAFFFLANRFDGFLAGRDVPAMRGCIRAAPRGGWH